MTDKKNQYDEEPVYYCQNCLSLKIKTVVMDSDLDFCDECGGTNISTIHIKEWENLYKKRYGFNYLNK